MAALIGSFLGIVLGSALLGALLAWILRKVASASRTVSYAVGTAVMTVVYALAGQIPPAPFDGGPGFVAFHVLGGLLGFALLWLTARRRKAAGAAKGTSRNGA